MPHFAKQRRGKSWGGLLGLPLLWFFKVLDLGSNVWEESGGQNKKSLDCISLQTGHYHMREIQRLVQMPELQLPLSLL